MLNFRLRIKRTASFLAVCLATGCFALNFWLKPHVEDQVRQALVGLKSSDGGAVSASATKITFAPFARALEMEGLHIEKDSPAGVTVYDIARLHAYFPLKALLICNLPGGRHLLPGEGVLPLINAVEASGITIQTPMGTTAVQNQKASGISVESDVLRHLADTATIPDPLTLIYQMEIESADASSVSHTMPETSSPTVTISEASLRGWKKRRIDEVDCSGVILRREGRDGLKISRCSESDITLPTEDQLRRFALLTDEAAIDQEALQALALEIFANETPLIGRFGFEGLDIAQPDGHIGVAALNVVWASSSPLDWQIRIEGITVSAAMLTAFFGCPLSGPDPLRMDIRASMKDVNGVQSQHEGRFKIQGMANLHYKFLADGKTGFTQQYDDVAIIYEDFGLLARLGLLLAPDGGAEDILSRSARAIFPHDASTADALDRFARKPGVLAISSLTNAPPLTLTDMINALNAGNLASILTINVKEGEETLAIQTNRLKTEN